GRLGMWGGSAFGHTQWALADQSRPGPTALMIQIASTSFREMFHPGGAFSLESALFWAARSGGPADVDPSSAALERGFEGFPVIEADEPAGGNVAFFDGGLGARPGRSLVEGDRRRGPRPQRQGPGAADGGLVRSVPAYADQGFPDDPPRGRPPRGAGHTPYRRPVDACRRRAISRRVDRKS